jgi:non-SMC mitotic condensation complex subunit 1
MRLVVDEDPLVRLRVLKKLPLIAKEIPNLCTVLTVHMRKMFVDTNWRIRKELALAMPEILRSMGQDHFCEQFLDHFLSLLNDDVGEVRLACAESLPKLATASNATWVHEILFPAVRELATGRCLIRLSMISALQGLIEAEISEKFQCEILSLVISASKDQVRSLILHFVIPNLCNSCNK